MKLARLLVALTFFSATVCAQAYEFKSVGVAPTIMYDSPSEHGIKRFIAPPGMPVEVVHTTEGWSKVRDASGILTWIETHALTSKRTLIVIAEKVQARKSPNDEADVVFTAKKDVLLNFVEPTLSEWVKVQHQDGEVAFVKLTDIWGQLPLQ